MKNFVVVFVFFRFTSSLRRTRLQSKPQDRSLAEERQNLRYREIRRRSLIREVSLLWWVLVGDQRLDERNRLSNKILTRKFFLLGSAVVIFD